MACMSFCFRVECLFRRKIGCEADYWSEARVLLVQTLNFVVVALLWCVRRGSFGERKEATDAIPTAKSIDSPRVVAKRMALSFILISGSASSVEGRIVHHDPELD